LLYEGAHTAIFCTSNASVLWYFKESLDSNLNIKINNRDSLNLFKVKQMYSGFYECRSTTSQGEMFSAYSYLKVAGT